jgi:hypothetical protein
MYDRSKGCNADTGQLGDAVTPTKNFDSGSELRAGLGPGSGFSRTRRGF